MNGHAATARAILAGGLPVLALCACGYFDLFAPLGRGAADLEEPPDTSVTWEKTFGGSGDDRGMCVQQTADGGYIIAGYTDSYADTTGAGGYDLWLLKTDAGGTELWSRTFGGAGDDRGMCVQQVADGSGAQGYVIVGYTDSFGAGGYDLWLLRTDAGGTELWSRTFGGADDDRGFSVEVTDDGGYFVAGMRFSEVATPPDLWVLKVGENGAVQWDRTFEALDSDVGVSVVGGPQGGCAVVGYTANLGHFEGGYLIKIDANGDKEWDRTFGLEWPDRFYSVARTTDGGYIAAGDTRSYGAGDFDAWLVRTDADGNELWSRTYGGVAWDTAECVRKTADGGYVLAGMTRSYGPFEQAWLLKTDGDGEEQWSRHFGGEGEDWARSVWPTADGGYILTGHTEKEPRGSGDFDLYLVYYKP